MSSESHIRHLEMIQAVVSRLANNSFLIKGWSVTLTTALFGFAVSSDQWLLSLVGVVVSFMLWMLDAYYLQKEKAYRKLYDEIRLESASKSLFTMDYSIAGAGAQPPIFAVVWTFTLKIFYGSLVICGLLTTLVLYFSCS